MEGKIIDIALKGIVRNTPGATCPDGEMEEMINLRFKDGAFRPIPVRLDYADVTGYDSIYVHSNAGYKHILGVAAGVLYWIGTDTDGVYAAKAAAELICNVASTPSYTQIGNVVNVLDVEGLKYVIWYDSKYVFINTAFDGEQTSESIGPVGKVDLKVEVDTAIKAYSAGFEGLEAYNNSSFTPNLNNDDAIISAIIKARAIHKENGGLSGFALACTALELYDGSYIFHSSPVLLGQASDKFTRFNPDTAGVPVSYTDLNPIISRITGTKTNQGDYSTFETPVNYLGHNTGSPSYVYTEHTSESVPSLNINYLKYYSQGGSVYQRSGNVWILLTSNKVQLRISLPCVDGYKALIKSVSVFMTPEIDFYDFKSRVATKSESSRNGYSGTGDMEYRDNTNLDYSFVSLKIKDAEKTDAALLKEISELQTFYKVHEIPYADIVAGDWVTVDLKGKLGDSMATLETLPIDPMSHHGFIPESQFVYNSKLHGANYKTLLSRGWPLNYFYAQQGVGQFPATGFIGPGEELFVEGESHYTKIEIKTPDGITSVIRKKDRTLTSLSPPPAGLGAMVSYPDRRATKMTIVRRLLVGSVWYQTIRELPLTPHVSQNFAYYLAEDLKPMPEGDSTAEVLGPIYQDRPRSTNFTVPNEVQREQTYSNAFKVSEINNPFTFPASTVYQVGNGEILGFASNAIALSTGQFGEFPLYVFCSDGVNAMYVGGGAITYSASKPVSRDVCSNPKSIKSVDGGVVFITDRGVMLLAGAQSQEISLPMRGEIFDFTNVNSNDYALLMSQAVNNAALVQLTSEVSKETFISYVQNAVVAYNYKEKEIWFTNPAKTYSYLYCRGMWAKVKQVGTSFVEDYPRSFLLNGGKLVDIGSEGTGSVQTMLLSRPIKMGTQGFKQSMRAVLRGFMEAGTPKHCGLYLFGSYDCQKWAFLGGTEKTGTLQDIGALVERVDCKYFRVGFVGQVSTTSHLDFLEVSVKPSLSGKLR